MSKISLNEVFVPLPEGTYVFKVTKVEYKEEFGKMRVTLKTADGKTHVEQFSLLGRDGEVNQGAMSAFSYFARACLGDSSIEEIDEQDLVGCYIRAEVKHNQVPSNKDDGKMMTFVNLGDKVHADGYDTPEKKSEFDLNSLLS